MKVRATNPGQYDNNMKNKGDVFDIKDDFFTPVWMEKVEEQNEASDESAGKKDQHDAEKKGWA